MKMNSQKMKFYYSPLSIGAILFLAWGVWVLIKMLRGAYPTYLAFILPILGILLLVIDYFVRKSASSLKAKLFIQTVSVVLIVIVGYLLLKG